MNLFTRNSPYYQLLNIYYSSWNTLYIALIFLFRVRYLFADYTGIATSVNNYNLFFNILSCTVVTFLRISLSDTKLNNFKNTFISWDINKSHDSILERMGNSAKLIVRWPNIAFREVMCLQRLGLSLKCVS